MLLLLSELLDKLPEVERTVLA